MTTRRIGIALSLFLAGCFLDPCYGARCAGPAAAVIVRSATPLESVTATTGAFTLSCVDESAGFAGTGWVCRSSSPVVGSHEVTVVADDRTEVVTLEVTSFDGCCGEVAQGTAILDLVGDGGT